MTVKTYFNEIETVCEVVPPAGGFTTTVQSTYVAAYLAWVRAGRAVGGPTWPS